MDRARYVPTVRTAVAKRRAAYAIDFGRLACLIVAASPEAAY